MVNNVKAGYVNPLTMMKDHRQSKQFNPRTMETGEKKQKALEAEKQSIQNSLLMIKSSGNEEASEENIELLEKKLEDITNEIRTNMQKIPEVVIDREEQTEEDSSLIMHNNFDRYETAEQEESTGCYKIVDDKEKGYKIEYDGMN